MINDVRWFCGRSNIGIVQIFDLHDGVKYYIGLCTGNSEEDDKQMIAEWGSHFPKEAGDVLFGVDELRNGNAVAVPQTKEQAILMYQMAKNYLGLGDVV